VVVIWSERMIIFRNIIFKVQNSRVNIKPLKFRIPKYRFKNVVAGNVNCVSGELKLVFYLELISEY